MVPDYVVYLTGSFLVLQCSRIVRNVVAMLISEENLIQPS